MARLENKTALVTGAASGIGRATALKLANEGANLILHTRQSLGKLESLADEIENSFGDASSRPGIFLLDFNLTDQLEAFVERVWNESGPIDIWINNAGGDVLTGEFRDLKFIQKTELLLKTDVLATLVLSRAVGKRMIEFSQCDVDKPDHSNGSFCIVNVGWDQAWQGMAGESGEMFATTKGGIMSMTGSLAQSLAPMVRVNCVAPGWIQTDWGMDASKYWNQRAVSESLMQRWGTPDDVASMIAFLASDEASFISGQIIPVNGGFRYGDKMIE